MAETVNIAEIANKLSNDIFRFFLWKIHPKRDDNFDCVNPDHQSDGGKSKISHPADAVFFYEDPYTNSSIYLNTDLKSYKSTSITPTRIRTALKSLCMTIECANTSTDWRVKYSIDPSESFSVRGFLFVHNYDGLYQEGFEHELQKVNLQNLPLRNNHYIYYMGPRDINRVYSIANDIIRLQYDGVLSRRYTFYYPDLVMCRRNGDVWDQPATIESLNGPYFIIKHEKAENGPSGYVIYYNRPGSSSEEFEYFLDSISRYQMLDSGEKIRVRVAFDKPDPSIRSNFVTAKKKYARVWGFDPTRASILDGIDIDLVTSVTSTYNPGDMGWRE